MYVFRLQYFLIRNQLFMEEYINARQNVFDYNFNRLVDFYF